VIIGPSQKSLVRFLNLKRRRSIVGAFVAAVIVYLIVGSTFAPAPGDGG